MLPMGKVQRYHTLNLAEKYADKRKKKEKRKEKNEQEKNHAFIIRIDFNYMIKRIGRVSLENIVY